MSLFNGKDELENDNMVEELSSKDSRREDAESLMAGEASSEIGYISAGTRIDGNITSNGHIVLNGEVTGNTSIKGNLVLNGTATGDIQCASLLVENVVSNSNITATDNVIVKENTSITGSVVCNNITVMGKIDGDIDAKGSVVLKSTSIVNGDITANRIGMESGAKVNGKIKTR